MPITTSSVKLTINCAKHGNLVSISEKCPACEFLMHYHQKMGVIINEVNSLNTALEGFMKTNQVVAVDLGGKFMTSSGAL